MPIVIINIAFKLFFQENVLNLCCFIKSNHELIKAKYWSISDTIKFKTWDNIFSETCTVYITMPLCPWGGGRYAYVTHPVVTSSTPDLSCAKRGSQLSDVTQAWPQLPQRGRRFSQLSDVTHAWSQLPPARTQVQSAFKNPCIPKLHTWHALNIFMKTYIILYEY